MNPARTRDLLQALDFRTLFVEELGWSAANGQRPRQLQLPQPIGLEATAAPIAQLGGLTVFRLDWPGDRPPGVTARRAVQRALAPTHAEHLVIYVANGGRQLAFTWARRRGEGRIELRTLPYEKDSPARTTLERLALLQFTLEELDRHPDAAPPITAVTAKLDAAFDVEAVTRQFYQEIANWYFWARDHVEFPMPKGTPNADAYKAQSLIRLITRLIFCWFVKQKGLIPAELFDARALATLLRDGAALPASEKTTYYKAILQNLFFATLNQEMDQRQFRKRSKDPHGRDPHRGITNLYRYEDHFADPQEFLRLMKDIPFLNGGLFECLDKVYRAEENLPDVRMDGFSDHPKNPLQVPDFLFFGEERQVDLSAAYGEKRYRQATVRGLIHTFARYNFTVTEATPLDQEVALDPELSGKVFENLLAAYNPETATTARKQTGSFYTPREIVDYMVDEALIACLKTKLEARPHPGPLPRGEGDTSSAPQQKDASTTQDVRIATEPANGSPSPPTERSGVGGEGRGEVGSLSSRSANSIEQRLRHLFACNDEPHQFSPSEVDALIAAIDNLKALDPACGSGAFPMGLLHKLVFLLGKLDPHNEQWKQKQIAKASEIPDSTVREKTLADIEQAFAANELDYGRKLYLIENCIYGVDIQPIAVQIAKMRFFISLIVDQTANPTAPNLGVRPLPNLETKFVAANALIGIEKPAQQMLRNPRIDAKEAELRRVRERHFTARTPATKARCREQDAKLRAEIGALLQADGFPRETTEKLARWDPYDQNASADFFDPEWMFGLREGFDIVTGNPPYVRIQTLTQTDAKQVGWLKEHYASASKGNYDLYVVFVERGLQLLDAHGQLAYILPHKFFNAQYGEPLRKLLADGKHLRHVVHFGDQQIFPGATNYVCLLFLAKAGCDVCWFVRVENLPDWLATLHGTEGTIPATRVTDTEWNFAVGKNAGLFEKLQQMPVRLADVAARIFQGIIPGADKVYTLEFLRGKGTQAICHSRALDTDVEIEADLLRPIVSGANVGRFVFTQSKWRVLYPYTVRDCQATLIPPATMRKEFPLAADYFAQTRELLNQRDGGSAKGTEWYRYIRTQNIGLQQLPKIAVPRLVRNLRACADLEGEVCLDNVDVGGVTLRNDTDLSPLYLLALLNSSVVNFYFIRNAAPFRGGFFSANRQFIEQLPIRPINFADAAERTEHDALVKLVERILAAKRADAAADVTAWEREIDERVYRLYGLTPEEIKIVEEAGK